MDVTIAELLEAYNAKYPEQVRDLAEMYCGDTTRLGGLDGAPVKASRDDVKAMAREQKVDVDLLRAAITDYSTIEMKSINAYLQRDSGKSSQGG